MNDSFNLKSWTIGLYYDCIETMLLFDILFYHVDMF